ncbi:MAG TPA: aminotransferase class III-fold pyridoxal phosphate-dependent enzyme [Verrucomicrobiota bacterium]|nr:aminotransferase class III-fold pyridoxal phosphate-dependent enzyme [Verrucomicrobiota bacterium]HNT13726.1 aminotransferase class III-fold pyridoxal phosphate-dependent enzyme [Verrucomicrobiota bacterium]
MTTPTLPATSLRPRAYTGPARAAVLAQRRQHVHPSIFHYYREPLLLVEGQMQYVWDEQGRRYLDGLGGIVTVSVGHCHPHVMAAGHRQSEVLQHATTIYLHPNLGAFAGQLAARLPGELKVCYFVNSGSEATDLALLMARVYTGNYDVIALRNAYHGGNASGMTVTAHSSWKFNVPHSFGVHHAIAPYPYRGPYGYDDAEAGRKYADDVKSLIDYATPGRVAAFIAESIQGVGGFVEFPPHYLQHVYAHVRAAGGVCIADEVQTGFGRLGTDFWGFETQGVVPDIVTMAKGIGNGYPLAAVVTTPQIAAALTGKIHFNTFGGNPVAMAIGSAVLEVIEREKLQANSLQMGRRIKAGLEKLQSKHPEIGDVRGRGLLLGVEIVKDRRTKAPGQAECTAVHEAAREMGLLLGKGGLWGQTIRLAPPMCINAADADFIVEVFDAAFSRL